MVSSTYSIFCDFVEELQCDIQAGMGYENLSGVLKSIGYTYTHGRLRTCQVFLGPANAFMSQA